jgi:acyl-CoA reductase-like NAD-dependent aldehyde dehydrogenase
LEMSIAHPREQASAESTIEIRNPATGEAIGAVPRAGAQDVETAIEAGIRGRTEMRNLPAHRRSDILRKASDVIASRHEELSQLLCRENGKTIRQCRGEMTATQRLFLDFSEEAKRLHGESIPMDTVAGLEHMIAYTIRKPLGLIVGIIPFNYPAELFAHKIPGALAAGNAAIVKLPEQCPLTVLELGKILIDAGLPPRALQMLVGFPNEMGDQLLTHPEIAMISFTGGLKSARSIAKIAAPHLKKTAFELGGVDAMLVMESADLAAAADAVVQGRLTNGAGQICCAVKQVLVAESVYEPFLSLLLKKVESINMGDPLREDTDLGPLISEQAAERVDHDVRRSLELGAECLVGGKRVGKNFYAPTVLVNVSSEMPCICDEVFGPVAPISPFKAIGSAVDAINSAPYGLQASVFAENIHEALGVSHRLEVGGIVVNGAGSFRPGNVPFGGVKLSGIGRESIKDTVREMTQETAIVLNQRNIF